MTDEIITERKRRKLERKPTETLYVNDAELIRRMGVPEKIARVAIRAMDEDRRSGFPKKQKLFGDRRYWPAVKAYLDRVSGLRLDAPIQPRERKYG